MLAFRDSLIAIQAAQECLSDGHGDDTTAEPEPDEAVPRRERLEGASVLNNGKADENKWRRTAHFTRKRFALVAARITTLPSAPGLSAKVLHQATSSYWTPIVRKQVNRSSRDAHEWRLRVDLRHAEPTSPAARAMGDKGA